MEKYTKTPNMTRAL